MRRPMVRVFAFVISSVAIHVAAAGQDHFEWTALPPLPLHATGQFIGVHDDVLIVAGGMNGSPLQPAPKEFFDTVYVLESGGLQWRTAATLPRARAFGGAAVTDGGLWCLGGMGAEGYFDDTLRIRSEDGAVVVDVNALPPLPDKCALSAATSIGTRIYIAGGLENSEAPQALGNFWSIDTDDAEAGWERLEAISGPQRIQPGFIARDGVLYLFGGAQLELSSAGVRTQSYLTDAYRYTAGSGWRAMAPLPRPGAGPAAVAYGQGHILAFGGDEVFAYHSITDTWVSRGTTSLDQGVSGATLWEERIIIVGGGDAETQDAARVASGRAVRETGGFGFVDYAIIAVYFAMLVAMGLYFSRREKDTEAFFLGSRRIPWWAVGLSIFGTSLSSITYLAIPAQAFATNWVTMLTNFSIFLVAPIVVVYYLPHYRRAPIVTAYEYLEARFNLAARIYGSLIFIAFQVGRISIVLYLPAIALSAATGMDQIACIVIMGVLATAYTVMGGIEAVIWTDVIQAFVLVAGALVALVIIVMGVDGGLGAMWSLAQDADKFHTFNWTWDHTVAAVWVCVIGSAFSNLYPLTSDQTVVQRYLSTATTRDAAKAVWTNALLTVPITLLFFGLGTALWTFFKTHPDQLDPALRNDAILPLFVVSQFPAGLGGLVIAGVFAAAMSSLDSSLNSLSAVLLNDYYRRFRPAITERHALRVARGITVAFGVLGTFSAIYVASLNAQTIFDAYLRFLGLVGGGLAGIFALGVFTKRAHGLGAIAGAVTSGVVLFYVRQTPTHFLLHGMVGFVTAFTVGYAVSLVTPWALSAAKT